MANKGKVYLVGAGPGDPELITVKGKRLLLGCEAVVYDRLVPLELVVTLPLKVQRYYVGKSAGKHSLPQDKINDLLVDLVGKGLKVVRLKGGDPLMFGRGGEEALYLKNKGIPFEIVPGITAGAAGSAYAGIPITHRSTSVFTIFVTAHEADGKQDKQVPWDWLGKVRNGSIVGYMGVKQLPSVVDKLIAGGMKPTTAAALIERGTTGMQRTIRGELQYLPTLAKDADVQPPSLFVIGDTVALADELSWFGKGFLSGNKVMVTRPASQAQAMYEELRSYGAEVLPLPTISITEHVDIKQWKELKTIFKSAQNRSDNNGDHWLVFTSENGVSYFFQQLREGGYDYRSIGNFSIAAVGTGTARALQEMDLPADFIPTEATTKTLAKELSKRIAGKDSRVIRVRGNLGDDTVERSLEAVKAQVIPLQVYRTSTAVWDDGMKALLRENPPDVITFTSGSTVNGLLEMLGKERALQLTKKAVVAAIGPVTAQIAEVAGIEVNVIAETYSVAGLVEAIVNNTKEKA
ncbi:uroporphyrinogen-III C-methyltransferase [candidate division LCP-89 bacterium B3_LCP]|uniref:uroporphyrinogen-III C-methyltransferase n=1 Tax=candidate division LCP-89 bacterium B3_LCP TaxID=2012998 RepID=A0A532UPF9_UNCL8|nr:MAG: uroporphyrinogen-III C-methyltransferase [candidate division LCP-89 bacterium B3_LCP]